MLAPEDRERYADDVERLARGYVREVSFDAFCVRKDGEILAARIWAVVVRTESWRPLSPVVTIEEIA